MWKLVFAAFLALLPVFWVQTNRIFALDKDVWFHHNEKCKRHTVPASILDFSHYDSEELIAVEENLMELFEKGADQVGNGRLVRVVDVAYASPKVFEIPILNFPSEIAFHPFGLYVESDLIYVLNQAFLKGGPRIEIFQYLDYQAIYRSSVILDPKVGLTVGDLVVKGEYAYLTQYSSIPLSPDGSTFSITSILTGFYKDITQKHESGVYKCKMTSGECTKQATSQATSVTGITKNQSDEILIAFTSIDYNWVEVYSIESNGDLISKHKFPLRDRAERLSYSGEFDKTYAGSLPWPLKAMTSAIVPGGAIEIKEKSGYSHRRLYMQEKDFKGGSAVGRIGSYIITSTYLDNAVFICPIVDP